MIRPALVAALAALAFGPPCLAGETPPHSGHAAPAAMSAKASTTSPSSPAAPGLRADLRALWHGHIVHTRDYALAVHARHDKQAGHAADAVVANARQLAEAVAGFYGTAAGDRMLDLLAGHWGAVQAMTDARFEGGQDAQSRAMTTLTANASEIAIFLAGANPNLPEDAVRGLLLAHGAHHSTQIQQIMAGDMQAEQATWSAMQKHMDTIADALAGAIAKQFPDKAA